MRTYSNGFINYYQNLKVGIIWLRLFGYGIHFKNLRKQALLFSERNGFVKRFQVGDWSIRFLTHGKP